MQRPCFALAVVLGWMAASVLVVGKANSQPVGTAGVVGFPGPATVHGGLVDAWVIGLVLGQSSGTSDRCGYDAGSDFAASDDGNRRGTGTSLAHRRHEDRSASYWFTTMATGYDPAYDFVLLEGRYLNIAPSRTDIEHSMAMERSPDPYLAKAHGSSHSANSLSCGDFDYWLDGERPTEWSTCWPVAIAKPSSDTLMYAEWLCSAQLNIRDWWSALRTHPSAVRIWATFQQAEYAVERAGEPVEVSVGTVVADFSTAPSTPDFSEEVLLISAADSLDRLGLALQTAAQRLRCLAADRVVAKGAQRRVAKK